MENAAVKDTRLKVKYKKLILKIVH